MLRTQAGNLCVHADCGSRHPAGPLCPSHRTRVSFRHVSHCRLRAQPPRRHTQDAWCSVLQSSDSDGIKVKTTKFWFNCSNTAQASHSTDRALSLTAAAPSTRVSSILISASLVGHWAGARAVPCPVFMKY